MHATRWGFAAICYIAVIGGMAAQAIFQYATKTHNFDVTSFMAPFVISPMIFLAFISIIKSQLDLLTGGLMAFQNGFFWKQIFDGLAPVLSVPGGGQ